MTIRARHSDHRPLRMAGMRGLGARPSRTMFSRFIAVAVTAVVISSNALAQQSFQALESMSQFDRALAAVDQIRNRKKLQCVLAIANGALCACLSRALPAGTYFRSYAAITNQEGEYEQLSVTDKTIVDRCLSDNRPPK
jgi:hypothetical protein